MADTLIQERYSLDFDAAQATENIIALAAETGNLRDSIDRAKLSGKQYEKDIKDLAAAEKLLIDVLSQEVNTYNAIVAKRRIMELGLSSLTKGSAQYARVTREITELEKRELNTIDGLNKKRQELRTQLGQLEIGSTKYKNTLKELNAAEAKAAKAAGDVTKGSGSFINSVKGGLAAIGITVGLQQVLNLGKEALQASAEKQQQKNALLTALNNQEDVQERLLAQADQLEATTLIDDDDIIALDRYLASLGLTEKQIGTLNNASVELAAVQGTSVRAAADKLIAAQSGQTKGIAKLVPEVKNLSKAQLAAGAAADLVAKKFAGSAAALNTGVAGLQNRLKDITEGFKEASGDAITRGFSKNIAAFSNLFGGEGGEQSLSRFTKALTDTIEDIISIPAYAVAGTKAVFAGIGAGFDFIKNRARIVFLDAQELFLKSQKFFGLQKEGDLERIAELQRARQVLQERNEEGFFGSVSSAAKRAFDEALQGTDDIAKGMKAIKKEGNDKGTDYLPVLKGEAKAVKGSLEDLEAQLGKLRERLNKFTAADDVKALTPVLQQIAALEKRIKAAKKLQDELLGKPIAPFEALTTKDVQQSQIAIEQARARIQEQSIKEQSAKKLRAIEEELTAELAAATLTTTQRENIEASFQAKREQLALETERAITANALTQKRLELAELQRTAPTATGGNADGIAKAKTDIAELEASAAALANKEILVDVKVDPSAKGNLFEEYKEIADAAVALFNEVSNAVSAAFERGEQRAAAAVDAQKTKLQDALANSEDFTAEQITLERDRLDKLQKEQERAAARARAAQATQIAVNTILAVVKAAGQTGVAAPVAILGVLAAITAGIAAASALAGSAFYDGVDYVPLGNNPKGRDTVPARLHEGEAVIQADKNKAYHPVVKAIRRGEIPAEILNDYVASWKGGSQMSIPKNRRIPISETVSGMDIGGGKQNNFYFQAKLNKLEREAETQTQILYKIEQNSRSNTTRQIRKPANRPDRFV